MVAMDAHARRDRAAPEAATLRVVADRLRRLRKAHGLTLRQLAKGTGTSASFLSQLERGLTGASTSTLMRIANCYSTSISELFEGADGGQHPVTRRQDRPLLQLLYGQRKTLLSRRPLTHFEAYLSEFEPGGSTGPDAYTHGDSQEMVVVLRGSIRLELGAEGYEMYEGDCIEYATSTPHRVVNTGDGRAEVLFVISPPTSTATYLDDFKNKRAAPDGESASTIT